MRFGSCGSGRAVSVRGADVGPAQTTLAWATWTGSPAIEVSSSAVR
jgi:hypothetical protein